MEFERVTIEAAYEELTPQAFAAWMRLIVTTAKPLYGRKKIAQILNYSQTQSDVVIRELKFKDYVKVTSRGVGKTSLFEMIKRPVLDRPTGFVVLYNWAHSPPAAANPDRFTDTPTGPCVSSNEKHGNRFQFSDQGGRVVFPNRSCETSVIFSGVLKGPGNAPMLENSLKSGETQGNSKKTEEEKPHKRRNQAKSNSLMGGETVHGIPGVKVPKRRVKMEVAPEDMLDPDHDRDSEVKGQKKRGGISLSKLSTIREGRKKERSDIAKKRAKESKTRSGQNKGSVNWDKLDQHGNPVISFSPSRKKRKKLIEILNMPDTNSVKRKILKKMTSEFGRIYSRYRRLLQRQRGAKPTYKLPPSELKYATRAAEWCIRKEVTPRQVLAYWHLNIANFAESKMEIPPLSFLSSPANIDTVACSSLDELEKRLTCKHVGHSFSDESMLDHRLRPALEEAGYETVLYNDRYLLTIQKTALSIARGANIFVGPEIRGMVNWAADNLYKDEK